MFAFCLFHLTGMSKLIFLGIQSNRITDLRVVENFKSLKHLYIMGNPIQDMTPIRRLREQIPNLSLDIQADP